MKPSITLSVYRASLSECLEILKEPRLLKALALSTAEELPKYLESRYKKYYIIQARDKKMLFHASHLGKGIYDFHVACPRKSILASRALITIAIKWVLDKHKNELKVLTTTCPEGKMANVCRKVGAVQIAEQAGKVHFVMPPTALASLKLLPTN